MKQAFNRRQFLEFLSAAGVAVYLPGCSDDAVAGYEKGVIVIGAGMAGLSAAYELTKKGYDVTVIEAQSRPGGRVHTMHDGLENGQYMELGATRIPDVHDHTLAYVEEFGLELVEFQSGDPLYYLKGQRFMHVEGEAYTALPGMTAEEQENGLGMWSNYVAAYFEEAGNPRDNQFPAPGITEMYDSMTWTDFVRSKGATEDWITLYTADNGSEISKIGAMVWLGAEVADQSWDKTFAVKGGNDQIPAKLAEALGERVLYNRPVTRILHDEDSVTVEFMNNGTLETLSANHLVCAIPFTTLRKVEISPAFPADKMQTINELFYMNSSRANFQTKSRFWQNEGIGGLKIVKTDGLAERLWDQSNVQEGETGVFVAYTQHENANAFQAVPQAEREEYITAVIEEFFPQIREQKLAYVEKVWGEDPWVEGAWTDLLPNQWPWYKIIGRAEGRVHFAGEHCSIWAGWMQGAIESAKRAVQEIQNA